jgi:hypothetical protein
MRLVPEALFCAWLFKTLPAIAAGLGHDTLLRISNAELTALLYAEKQDYGAEK